MFSPYLACLACLLLLSGPGAALPTDQQPLGGPHELADVQFVRAMLQRAEIIPTVIDDFIPTLTIDIAWKKDEAELGNTIKTKKVQEQPSITLHDATNPDGCATDNMTYVVTLTDPDAPSRDNPEWSEMCHWIAANVSLSQNSFSILPLPQFGLTDTACAKGEKSKPDDLVSYKPPGPPPKTGKHRYVFLVFAPGNGTTLPLNLTKPKDRKHWGTGSERHGVRDWAKDNGLVPVAANFIYAQNKKQ